MLRGNARRFERNVFETSGISHPATWRHIPEDKTPQQQSVRTKKLAFGCYLPINEQGLKNSYLLLDFSATVVHIIFIAFTIFSTPSLSHTSWLIGTHNTRQATPTTFFIKKTNRRTNFPIYFLKKLYMIRAVPLLIIRSFPLYIRHWHMSCRFDDSFQARPGWNCVPSW